MQLHAGMDELLLDQAIRRRDHADLVAGLGQCLRSATKWVAAPVFSGFVPTSRNFSARRSSVPVSTRTANWGRRWWRATCMRELLTDRRRPRHARGAWWWPPRSRRP
ncbi:hypothetical protein RLIN73S_06008 [Rhodanobacter lindaniclasticus]